MRNYYKSIDDLPIYYWDKVHHTGNIFLLNKSGSKSDLFGIRKNLLKKHWRFLLDEYIEKFGFSPNYLAIMRKQKEILRLITDRAVNDNKSLNAFIKIAYTELASLKKDSGSMTFWELKGALDRAGYNINVKETSVSEFYSHIKTLSKQANNIPDGRRTN